MANQQTFFLAFGNRVRELRKQNGYSQGDMISFGFSARHWQQIEAGRPITVSTLLRICEAFHISAERLVQGLDRGIYGDEIEPLAVRSGRP
jgi:transcriptional regulator with XRE-family HTH domain